ncbi:MAG: nuclear transport factor 2 family protein [Candidatus Aminicenantes bacterium]|nr:MAG: nuclear transport factor 2 family protein [Candidatus Aminicenantes bacterium]
MKKAILIVLLTLLVLLMGFSPMPAAAGSSQEQQNMEVVKKVFEVFKTKDVDSLDNLMGKDFPEQATKVFKHWWKQFSEVKAEINDIFASGDKIAVRWTFYGIKDRDLEENWQIHFISIFQLANGKVVDMWHGDDFLNELKKHGFNINPPVPKTFEGKLKATMSDMHTVGRALKHYIEDYHRAPQTNSIKELSKILQPFYIKTLPLADAWKNEILYKVDPKNPKNYWIGSSGSDGKFEGFDQKGTWNFEEGEKGQDIVLANGDFTYMPNLEKKK